MFGSKIEIPTGSIDGSNRLFYTTQAYIPGSTQLWLNGQAKVAGNADGWEEVGVNAIRTAEAPRTKDVVQIGYNSYFL